MCYSRQIKLAAVVFCSLLFVGCGAKRDRPELGIVSGTVTLNGSPLPNAQVAFEPTSGRASYGKTDESGKYSLRYLPKVQGAKIGTHVVRISTNLMVHDPVTGSEKLMPELLQEEYNTESKLTAEVQDGNNDIDFQLEGGKAAPKKGKPKSSP